MTKKTPKQHKCKSIVEYRSILYVYNPTSANYFRGLNKVYSKEEMIKYLQKHQDRRFGVKIA